MKSIILAAAITIPAFFAAQPASAQNARVYPWCAEYGGGNGGRNCGFETLNQCRMAISGDNRATCIYLGPDRAGATRR